MVMYFVIFSVWGLLKKVWLEIGVDKFVRLYVIFMNKILFIGILSLKICFWILIIILRFVILDLLKKIWFEN